MECTPTKAELAEPVRETVRTSGNVHIAHLAGRHGEDFTGSEGEAVWSEVSADAEPDDFEPDRVAGVGRLPDNAGDTRFSAEKAQRSPDGGLNTAIG